MKNRYQISISDVRRITNIYKCLDGTDVTSKFEQNEIDVKKHLLKIFANYKKDKIIDGEVVKQLFFPSDLTKNFKVFISHSSDDKDDVRVLAKYLEANGIDCFVDWMVWGNMYKLQIDMDNNMCLKTKDDGSKYYDYNLRNYTTAHAHAMLSMALLDMIDSCDIFLFISSENSTLPSANFTDVKTLSPWIYEEISYVNHIMPRRIGLYSEGASMIRISHPLDLSGFKSLTNINLLPTLTALNESSQNNINELY